MLSLCGTPRTKLGAPSVSLPEKLELFPPLPSHHTSVDVVSLVSAALFLLAYANHHNPQN